MSGDPIAGRLGAIGDDLPLLVHDSRRTTAPQEVKALLLEQDQSFQRAAEHLRAQKVRLAVFGEDAPIFADPAWTVMLETFVAAARGEMLTVSVIGCGYGLPTTTALRAIGTLENRGLLCRSTHPTDKRKRYVAITARGDALIREWSRATSKS